MAKKIVKKRIQKKNKPAVRKRIVVKQIDTNSNRRLSGRDALLQNRAGGFAGGFIGGVSSGGSGGGGPQNDALNKMENERKARYESERLVETLRKNYEEEKKLRTMAENKKKELKEQIREDTKRDRLNRKSRSELEKLEDRKKDLEEAIENGVSEERLNELRSEIDVLQRRVNELKDKEKQVDENIKSTPLIGKIMDLKTDSSMIQARLTQKEMMTQRLIDAPTSELERVYGQEYVNNQALSEAEKLRDEVNKSKTEQRKYAIQREASGVGMDDYWRGETKGLQEQLIMEENNLIYEKNEAEKSRAKEREYNETRKMVNEMRVKRLRAQQASRLAHGKVKSYETDKSENDKKMKDEEREYVKAKIETEKLKENEESRKEKVRIDRENKRVREEKEINDIIDSGGSGYTGKDPKIISLINLNRENIETQSEIGRGKAEAEMLKRHKNAREENFGLKMDNIRRKSQNEYSTTEDGARGMANLAGLAAEKGSLLAKNKILEDEHRSGEEVRKMIIQNEVKGQMNNEDMGPNGYLQVMDKAKTMYENAVSDRDREMKERRELIGFIRSKFNENNGLWDAFKEIHSENYGNMDDTIFSNDVDIGMLRDIAQKIKTMLANGSSFYYSE